MCLGLGLQCGVACAALTCEQLTEIALATQNLRDQGSSLAVVLAEANKLEAASKLTPAELDMVRLIVEQAYLGIRSPYEVYQVCRDAQRR